MDRQRYLDEHQRLLGILQHTFSMDGSEQFEKTYDGLADIEQWIQQMIGPKEVFLYRAASDELDNALYLIACGMYRQAYVSLRFFLEHTLFGIFLSTNDMCLRLWYINEYDSKWSTITDEETGIFSRRFFTVFAPELLHYRDALQDRCKRLYREFPEFAHGNYHTTKILPRPERFDKRIVMDLLRDIQTMHDIVLFMFFARYWEGLSVKSQKILQETIMRTMGQYPEIIAMVACIGGNKDER